MLCSTDAHLQEGWSGSWPLPSLAVPALHWVWPSRCGVGTCRCHSPSSLKRPRVASWASGALTGLAAHGAEGTLLAAAAVNGITALGPWHVLSKSCALGLRTQWCDRLCQWEASSQRHHQQAGAALASRLRAATWCGPASVDKNQQSPFLRGQGGSRGGPEEQTSCCEDEVSPLLSVTLTAQPFKANSGQGEGRSKAEHS